MASQTGKGEDQDRGLKERVIKEALGQKGKISPCDPKGAQLSSSSELKLAAKPDDKHCMCLNIVFTKSANSKSLGWVPHVPKGLINRAYVMKPPQKSRVRGLESTWVSERVHMPGGWGTPNSMGSLCSGPFQTLPCVPPLHLAVYLYPLVFVLNFLSSNKLFS